MHNHIRGLSPFPGAWFEIGGVRVKALRSTKAEGSASPARRSTTTDNRLWQGAVCLTLVQRAGKQPMSADEFLRGTPVKAGTPVA